MSEYVIPTIICRAFLLFLFVLGASQIIPAQSITGGGAIQGIVKDMTGSALPGAKITIRNLATGVDTNASANSDGAFITPSLPIGRYRVRVEAPGMKAWQGELIIETGRTAEIYPVLAVGDVSETVII